ncbi:MAG: type 1 glutamine amidotransferase [Bryobacteraceae bacterium]
MPRVLVFRHVPHEHLGYIATSLELHGIDYFYVDLALDAEQELPFPVQECDGVISMGGPMSANDPDAWVRQEMRYLAQAMTRSKPILGVCLGSQIIARTAGARVYRNGEKEIGWFPVYPRPEAAQDPLLAGFGESEPVFHWHGETFDLPAGAVWLASSDRCAHQAYRIGRNIYALQFHLEVSPEMIAGWLMEDLNQGDLREVNEPIHPQLHAARLKELSSGVFDGWCRLASRGCGQ